MIQLHRAVNHT